MLVDIKLKYLCFKTGENSLLSPVAAIKDFTLEDQKEMWLFRTGLMNFKDYNSDSHEKFTFMHNSGVLTTL